MVVVASRGKSSRNSKDDDLLSLEGASVQNLGNSTGVLELGVIWANSIVARRQMLDTSERRLELPHCARERERKSKTYQYLRSTEGIVSPTLICVVRSITTKLC